MTTHHAAPHTHDGTHRGTVASYTVGFIGSIICTFAAYDVVVGHVASAAILAGTIVALGLTQLVIQLVLFLHLGRESGPKWNLLALAFAVIIIVIVVAGALWIMYNLNMRMMLNFDVNAYLMSQN